MGRPVLEPEKIPTRLGRGAGPLVDVPLEVGGEKLRVTVASRWATHTAWSSSTIPRTAPVDDARPAHRAPPGLPEARERRVRGARLGRSELVQRTWERGTGRDARLRQRCLRGRGGVRAAAAARERDVSVALRGGTLGSLAGRRRARLHDGPRGPRLRRADRSNGPSAVQGVFTALVTPFRADGAVDATRCASWSSGRSRRRRRLVPCGSTGEAATLSHEEHVRVVRDRGRGRAAARAGDRRHGLEHHPRGDRADRGRARRAGADGALLISPYYNKPTQEGHLPALRATVARETGFPLVDLQHPRAHGVEHRARDARAARATSTQRGRREGVRRRSSPDLRDDRAVRRRASPCSRATTRMTLPMLAVGGARRDLDRVERRAARRWWRWCARFRGRRLTRARAAPLRAAAALSRRCSRDEPDPGEDRARAPGPDPEREIRLPLTRDLEGEPRAARGGCWRGLPRASTPRARRRRRRAHGRARARALAASRPSCGSARRSSAPGTRAWARELAPRREARAPTCARPAPQARRRDRLLLARVDAGAASTRPRPRGLPLVIGTTGIRAERARRARARRRAPADRARRELLDRHHRAARARRRGARAGSAGYEIESSRCTTISKRRRAERHGARAGARRRPPRAVRTCSKPRCSRARDRPASATPPRDRHPGAARRRQRRRAHRALRRARRAARARPPGAHPRPLRARRPARRAPGWPGARRASTRMRDVLASP